MPTVTSGSKKKRIRDESFLFVSPPLNIDHSGFLFVPSSACVWRSRATELPIIEVKEHRGGVRGSTREDGDVPIQNLAEAVRELGDHIGESAREV